MPAPSIYDSPVHPRAASCQSLPTDAPAHFSQPSLHALSPSSCIRPSFPLWTEPMAPPLPVLRHLHHVWPPAAPSACTAQPQPHTSFLAHAACALVSLVLSVGGAARHQALFRPPPHVLGLCMCPAPSSPMPSPSRPLHRLTHSPGPTSATSITSCPGCSTVIQLFHVPALLCLFCPQPLSRANVLQFTGRPFPRCSPAMPRSCPRAVLSLHIIPHRPCRQLLRTRDVPVES